MSDDRGQAGRARGAEGRGRGARSRPPRRASDESRAGRATTRSRPTAHPAAEPRRRSRSKSAARERARAPGLFRGPGQSSSCSSAREEGEPGGAPLLVCRPRASRRSGERAELALAVERRPRAPARAGAGRARSRPGCRRGRADSSRRARTLDSRAGRAPRGRRAPGPRRGAAPPSVRAARNPVDSAASREKRVSFVRSSITSGCRVTSTQPATPVLAGSAGRGACRSLRRRRPRRRARRPPRRAARRTTPSRGRSRARPRRSPAAARGTRSSAPRTPAATAARRSVRPPPTFVAVRCSTLFSWNGVSSGCLPRMSAQSPATCGVAKLLPVALDRLAAEPRDVDVQAAREELDRRRRVGVEDERVGVLVAADRDDAREPPGEALDRHVVRRGDEHRALEVGGVGELVQPVDVLLLRRRQAHVDDVEALLDRPLEPGEQHRRAAGVAGAEHADARQLALGRERADDPGARGAVAAEVARGRRPRS